MEKIDITIPTTLRPGLLEKTLDSFCKNVFTDRNRYRLIFNVDPIGEDCDPMDVVKVAGFYFDDILYNIAEKPSFPKAFMWCWNHAESDYLFHINEDWELLRPINIDDMIDILEKTNNLACLRLLRVDIPNNFNGFSSEYKYIDMGKYLRAERRDASFSTSPELIKAAFYKEARKYLLNNKNPEKQFRPGNKVYKVVKEWDYAFYAKPGDKMLIKDIGRDWMAKNKFRKKGGHGFTEWEKIK